MAGFGPGRAWRWPDPAWSQSLGRRAVHPCLDAARLGIAGPAHAGFGPGSLIQNSRCAVALGEVRSVIRHCVKNSGAPGPLAQGSTVTKIHERRSRRARLCLLRSVVTLGRAKWAFDAADRVNDRIRRSEPDGARSGIRFRMPSKPGRGVDGVRDWPAGPCGAFPSRTVWGGRFSGDFPSLMAFPESGPSAGAGRSAAGSGVTLASGGTV